jgi:uncharacterized MAPEG superfamily protein
VTTPFWCLLIVAILPYLLAGFGAQLRAKQLGTLDNHHPRVQAQELRGPAARAYAAQQNAWEALSLFGVAVVLAHLSGADPDKSAAASILFLVARVLHPAAYIGDVPTLRSGIFLIGLGSCIWLFALSILA